MRLYVKNITLREANAFVTEHHRHHGKTAGCKWALGCYDDNKLVGVAICSRPVARKLDDGWTVEVTRLCTDGTRNACSKLYGACTKVASAMGYRKIITYILESENGASVRAANFKLDSAKCGGIDWSVPSRPRNKEYIAEYKQRYSLTLKGG